jgi:transposase
MARRGRPTVEITLTGEERKTLEAWARRHSSAQSLALRCKIVLGCAEGLTDREVAAILGVNPVTVGKWRHRFADERLDGLVDAPRPGAVRTVGDDVVEAVVVDTLESAPADATHWSTRGLAKKHGISRQTVSEIWRAFGLKPWKEGSFKVSSDPLLVEKIRDIVGLYLNPPVAAVVFAVDERPQIQALNRTAPTFPMLPGTPARATHDYERAGTCDLFAALNIATGTVITDIKKSHTAEDFLAFFEQDQRGGAKRARRRSRARQPGNAQDPEGPPVAARHRRFHFHFTPTYGSWMNLVERWFSALTTKKLQRSAHRSVRALAADIEAWVANWNEDPKPFVWHKSADEILERLASYCSAVTENLSASS